MNSGVWLNY